MKCGKLKGKSISKTLVMECFLRKKVFFQAIQFTMYVTFCILMLKLHEEKYEEKTMKS